MAKKWYFVPVILWAIGILIGTSTPHPWPPPINITFFDKFEHLGAYGGLGFLMAFAFIKSRSRPLLILALGICALFGILDEIHQIWIPNRSCDPLDVSADFIGSAGGIGLYLWLKSRLTYLAYRQAPSGDSK